MNEVFICLNELGKHVFHWEKWNFEPIANSAHTTEIVVLRKVLNIYIDHLLFYPSRKHVR